MTIALLLLALLVVLVLMLVRRRNLTALTYAACLIGAAIMLIWMQDTGLWPGTKGPLTPGEPSGATAR